MKKTVLVFLCVLFAFSFCACKSNNNKSAHSVDIAYFIDMGKVPETNYKIGDGLPSTETIENNSMIIFENESPAFFTDGAFNYYYSSEKKVITEIIGFDKCLGFETGTISIEVTDALDEQNIKYTEREPSDGELFFLPGANNRSVIECKELKYSLIFVFEDNALCATILGE